MSNLEKVDVYEGNEITRKTPLFFSFMDDIASGKQSRNCSLVMLSVYGIALYPNAGEGFQPGMLTDGEDNFFCGQR